MRLVCDKCSSVYTIEDHLVGTRDFSVTCKECSSPIVVRREARPSLPSLSGSSALALSQPRSFAPNGNEAWYVSIAGSEQGPYGAAELGRLLEQERVAWTTPVWREGLKDWRPARRDAVLVTAVAGARGHAGDTMRLDSVRSFLSPEDTIVDTRFGDLALAKPAHEQAEDLLSSNSDTQALDMRQQGLLLPDLKPSERPQAWSTPENAAFRAGLGLPADSAEVAPSGPALAERARTLGDAFRSAPSLMRATPSPESTAEISLGTQTSRPVDVAEGWMPRPRSMITVALVAFSAGLIAAALWSYFAGRRPAVIARPVEMTERVSVAAEPASAPPMPSGLTTGGAAPRPPTARAEALRELPDPEELRAEVREVAPLVRRCLLNPAQGVDVDIYLDGPSGRVRDVQVRSPMLAPGRVQCITHAVRQMQLEPFVRHELKLMHKFSW
jgi:predicted Zn finger-like uncharacterized protein